MTRTHRMWLTALVVIGVGLATVVSLGQSELHSTQVRLDFPDDDVGIELRTWSSRESDRLAEQGAALIPRFADAEFDIGVRSGPDRLVLHVVATDPIPLAEALALTAAADLARLADDADHDRLRAAELGAGVPSPERARRPHVAEAPPETVDPTDGDIDRLDTVRRELAGSLEPGVLGEAQPIQEVQPRTIADAVAAIVVGLLIVGVVWFHQPLSRLLAGSGDRRPSDPWVRRAIDVTLWTWVVAALVGRVAAWIGIPGDDWLANGLPLVGALPLVAAIRQGVRPQSHAVAAVVVAAAVSAAALVIGLVEHGATAALVGLASWGGPLIVVAAAVLADSRAAVVEPIRRFFDRSSVPVAVYGLVQLVIVPPWDREWLETSAVISFGRPEPFEVRVFSTLSAPAALGVYAAMGLLLTHGRPDHDLRWPRIAFVVSLALTLHRSSWLALAVGGVVLAAAAGSQLRPPRPRSIGAGLLGLGALALVPSVRDRVTDTFADGLSDVSLNERLTLHRDELASVLLDPVGSGFGTTGSARRFLDGDSQVFDTLWLEAMATFGGPLVVAALIAIGWLTISPRSPIAWRRRPTAAAVVAALVIGGLFMNVAQEPIGYAAFAAIVATVAAAPVALARPEPVEAT